MARPPSGQGRRDRRLPAQLATARRLQRRHGLEFPLIEADAEQVPCRGEAFDLAISEYGACLWADPDRWVAEAALSDPGAELIFLVNSPLFTLCVPEEDGVAAERLLRPAFGMRRIEWPGDPGVEFHLAHGDWIRVLRRQRLLRGRGSDRGATAGVGHHELRIRHTRVGARKWRSTKNLARSTPVRARRRRCDVRSPFAPQAVAGLGPRRPRCDVRFMRERWTI